MQRSVSCWIGRWLHRLKRDFLFRLPDHRVPQRIGVVGVDPGVVPSAADRRIELPAGDQLGAAQ
jgi:hypothetical protein